MFVLVVNAGDKHRPADGVSKIIFLVWRHGRLRESDGVKSIIANKLVGIAVKLAGAGFGFNLDRTRSAAAILRTIIGGQHLEFSDSIQAGINVQRSVAAVIHVVAAVQFPVVVFGASAVDAERNVAAHTDSGIILARLITDARYQCDQLREVAPIELELADFFSGDRTGEFGRLGFNLGNIFA